MDVVLICFSQTGNTRQVATAMAGAFRGAAHSARTMSLKEAIPEDATKGELLGVGTPCFSSHAPTPIKEFIRALPPLDGQPAFVFATASGAPGRVLYDLTSLLRSKGADVLGAESRPDALKRGWDFYDFVGLAGSDRLLRLLMPEPKLNPDKCDRCRRCVYECPMDNITLQPLAPSTSSGHRGLGTTQAQGRPLRQAQGRSLLSYPVPGDRCIRCYRCLTGCPQRAFDVNWRLADPFLLFLYNASFMRWFGDLAPGEQIY
jgi:ferredoxin